MRTYIDEAGLFVVPPSGSDSFSLVLSLVVPSTTEGALFYDFLRLRDEWPVKCMEIKGSSLDESQTAQVIEVCLRHDVLVEFLAVNMATHDQVLVSDFKRGQADELLANVTPQHKPYIVQPLKQMSNAIHKMPNQLFLQAFVTVRLLLDLMPEALLYYGSADTCGVTQSARFIADSGNSANVLLKRRAQSVEQEKSPTRRVERVNLATVASLDMGLTWVSQTIR